jgi:hypothetical protein
MLSAGAIDGCTGRVHTGKDAMTSADEDRGNMSPSPIFQILPDKVTDCFALREHSLRVIGQWARSAVTEDASMTDKAETRPADALDDQDLEAVHGGISGSEILQTVFRVATAVVPAALQAVQAKGFEPLAQQGIVSAPPQTSQGINSVLISQGS